MPEKWEAVFWGAVLVNFVFLMEFPVSWGLLSLCLTFFSSCSMLRFISPSVGENIEGVEGIAVCAVASDLAIATSLPATSVSLFCPSTLAHTFIIYFLLGLFPLLLT